MQEYGFGDATYRAAGETAGVRALVDSFYDIMAREPEYARVYAMHPPDNALSREKLAVFLCGWMGGPSEYAGRFGPIRLPMAHAHLDVTAEDRDHWLACMTQALADQPYPNELRAYLLRQLSIPAERVHQVSAARQAH